MLMYGNLNLLITALKTKKRNIYVCVCVQSFVYVKCHLCRDLTLIYYDPIVSIRQSIEEKKL